MRIFISAIALVAAAGAAEAQYSQELGSGALDSGAQIEDGGPGSSPFFMNAQGVDGEEFSEFYVMRFDLAGYSGAAVDSVTIDLRHAEAFFSNSGQVRLSYSADDATPFSALAFDENSFGGNNGQLTATEVALFDFVDLPGDDTTTVDTITLNDAGGFFADIQSTGIVTLVLEAVTPGTSATYGGIGSFDGGPVINITEVPAPGAAALFGLAGLSAARRRR